LDAPPQRTETAESLGIRPLDAQHPRRRHGGVLLVLLRPTPRSQFSVTPLKDGCSGPGWIWPNSGRWRCPYRLNKTTLLQAGHDLRRTNRFS
jgi:hypothetical protein